MTHEETDMRALESRFLNGCRLILTTTLLLLAVPAWSQAPAIDWDLDEAIRQIERQGDDFSSVMSRVEVVNTDADGIEVDRQSGTGFIREDGRMRYNVDGGNRVIMVDKNKVSIYDAPEKIVNEYSLAKNKSRLEPFARLGFSTTGKDLKDNYLITILGEEELGDSRTLVLELTPKRDNVRASVRMVRLWIDQSSWMPKQQEFNSTSDGSKLLITYSGMARNLQLNQDLFKVKWPKGTKTVKQ
jgi:outer membrane lipoprotein-sorting protein